MHYDRCQRYLEFILETRSAICEGDSTGAIATLDAFTEAVKSFQKDVTVADKYEGGWQLVSRYKGEDEEDVEIRKLNQKIMEERSRRRGGEYSNSKYYNKREHSQAKATSANILEPNPPKRVYQENWGVQEGPSQGGTQAIQYFPGEHSRPPRNTVFRGDCIWCQKPGHSYKVQLRVFSILSTARPFFIYNL